MPDNDDNDDKKVKDLLDAATQADLARWFGLPSFEQLAEQGVAPEPPRAGDAEVDERQKRQNEALAAVDPAWLDAFDRRITAFGDILKPLPPLALRVDPSIARLDHAMVDQRSSVADPREVELPGDLSDALAERTPQALLRDLHRPELDFYKVFERTDVIADYRVDLAATITEVMTRREPPAWVAPFRDCHALLLELRAERHQPWTNIDITPRRVTE